MSSLRTATTSHFAACTERAAALALRLAMALPILLCLALLLAVAAGVPAARAEAEVPSEVPAEAEDEACVGASLMETLRDAGTLAAVREEAAAIPNGEGRLFRIEKPGLAPSWLFGTMHLADPRVLQLPPEAERAFGDARMLVIETTDILDKARSAAALLSRPDLINLPAGTGLADLLDEEEERRVRAALEEKGIPFEAIQTLQPWFSGVSLLLPACEQARKADGAMVLDLDLAARAAAAAKPVKGLETALEQLEALASLPLDLQAESLVATLDLAASMPDILQTMIELYLAGDIATIMPAIEAAVPAGGALVGAGEAYAAFEERVVTIRNRTMAERAQPFLKEGGAFVAVGALHLPGESGLVELLRERDWRVTRAD